MADGMKLVRLKPYNPRAGFVQKEILIRGGAHFEAGKWYRVTADMAAYLKTYRARPGTSTSPLSFDVCDNEADAKEFVRREEEEKRRGKRPEDAVDMARAFTTTDLPSPVSVSPDKVEATGPAQAPEPEDEEEEESPPPKPKRRKAKAKRKRKAKAKRGRGKTA